MITVGVLALGCLSLNACSLDVMLIQCERVANVELNVIRDVHNDDVHVIGDVLVVDVIQL